MYNYEIEYNHIVKNRKPMIYRGPEHQTIGIKRCSILKQVKEIKYHKDLKKLIVLGKDREGGK